MKRRRVKILFFNSILNVCKLAMSGKNALFHGGQLEAYLSQLLERYTWETANTMDNFFNES